MAGVHEQEAAGAVGVLRHARGKASLAEGRRLLVAEEEDKLIDMDAVTEEALRRAEQDGIIFIDEIDKVAGRSANGPDVSREGVQRDILPAILAARQRLEARPELMAILAPALQGMENDL